MGGENATLCMYVSNAVSESKLKHNYAIVGTESFCVTRMKNDFGP